MCRHSLSGVIAALGLAIFTETALAHTGVRSTSTLTGFLHPFTGLDHVLAMLAVGLWAGQRGGRAVWLWPLTFMTAMLLGGLWAVTTSNLTAVELGLAGSVFVLGAVVAANVSLHTALAVTLIAAFALFHGHAHGAEMPGTGSAGAYVLGFVLATGLLHGLGLTLGMTIGRRERLHAVRLIGGAIAVVGLGMMA